VSTGSIMCGLGTGLGLGSVFLMVYSAVCTIYGKFLSVCFIAACIASLVLVFISLELWIHKPCWGCGINTTDTMLLDKQTCKDCINSRSVRLFNTIKQSVC